MADIRMAFVKNQVIEKIGVVKYLVGYQKKEYHTSKMKGLPGMYLKTNKVQNPLRPNSPPSENVYDK